MEDFRSLALRERGRNIGPCKFFRSLEALSLLVLYLGRRIVQQNIFVTLINLSNYWKLTSSNSISLNSFPDLGRLNTRLIAVCLDFGAPICANPELCGTSAHMHLFFFVFFFGQMKLLHCKERLQALIGASSKAEASEIIV